MAEDSILNMSDEDFLNLPDDYDSDDTEEQDIEDTDEESSDVTDNAEHEESSLEETVEENSEKGTDTELDVEDSEEDESKEIEEKSEEEKSEEKVDFEEQYNDALSPLQADGEELKIESIKELRNLASMGVNYYGKMQALKPHRKTIKTLTDNAVDEKTLDYLLELKEGKPEAIKKLLQDHKVDPQELDLEEVNKDYAPESYTPSDISVDLDIVLDEVRTTPTYDKTMDILGNQWDGESKQILQENPKIIKDINSHVASGIYDKIALVVKKERLMGKLDGVSDIVAYKKIGEFLHSKGEFDSSKPKEKKVIKPETKKADDINKGSKKKRAVSPSSKNKTNKLTQSSVLEMSDEEFEKQFSGSALYE